MTEEAAPTVEPGAEPAPIIGPSPVTVEPAHMFLLMKARQFEAEIKNLQAHLQSLMHGFAFGRGVNLQTHQVLLDTDKATITICPIQSESKK